MLETVASVAVYSALAFGLLMPVAGAVTIFNRFRTDAPLFRVVAWLMAAVLTTCLVALGAGAVLEKTAFAIGGHHQ